MPRLSHLTAAERRLHAQLAANTGWAQCDDRSARTAPARRGMLAKFEAQVDPDGVLTPAERAKRAENARRAHMQKLALKSSKNRRLRKQAQLAGDGGAV